jgi:hypothetical protein
MASEPGTRSSLGRLVAFAFFLAFCSATLLGPAIARAEPSSADKETARTLMKEGDEKFAAKDFDGAAKAYQTADDLMHVPTTGLALAKADIELGKLVEARDVLLDIGRRPKEPGEQLLVTKARDEAADLATKIAARIPSVVITVEGPPSGADIALGIDGESVPAATIGVPRKVNPGAHTITASAPGFAKATTSVTVGESEEQKVPMKLVPGASGGGATSGATQLHIVSPDKPGNVIVDGKAVGATPLDVPVAAGTHKIEIEYPGGSRDDRTIDVKAGKTAEVNFRPSIMDELGRHRRLVHVGFSIAPAMNIMPDFGAPLYGGDASFVFHIGITPAFEFRTGVKAGYFMRGNSGAGALEFTGTIPLALQVNLNAWLSMWGGLSAGFALLKPDGGDLIIGPSIGPEWSLFTLCAGDKRQYELGFAQGVRFGELPIDYHQSVVFTMLFLD